MENYGFQVVTDEEARSYGFIRGSGMFDELFRAMKQEIGKNPAAQKWYENADMMTEEEKRISFLNRYFIFKKAHNVNAEKVAKIVEIAEEVEEKAIENEIEKDEKSVGSKGPLSGSNGTVGSKGPLEKAPAKKPRAKKIKSAEKVQLSDFVPIEEDVEPAPEKEEVPVGAKDKDQDKDPVGAKGTLKVSETVGAKGTLEKAARCKDGTKKYKPMGDGCYTDEEIAAYKLNKTKKTTDKK